MSYHNDPNHCDGTPGYIGRHRAPEPKAIEQSPETRMPLATSVEELERLLYSNPWFPINPAN